MNALTQELVDLLSLEKLEENSFVRWIEMGIPKNVGFNSSEKYQQEPAKSQAHVHVSE